MFVTLIRQDTSIIYMFWFFYIMVLVFVCVCLNNIHFCIFYLEKPGNAEKSGKKYIKFVH